MIVDAFDVIQQVTLSDTMGFIDAGGDIDGFFRNLDAALDRSGLVSYVNVISIIVKLTNYLVGHHAMDNLSRQAQSNRGIVRGRWLDVSEVECSPASKAVEAALRSIPKRRQILTSRFSRSFHRRGSSPRPPWI